MQNASPICVRNCLSGITKTRQLLKNSHAEFKIQEVMYCKTTFAVCLVNIVDVRGWSFIGPSCQRTSTGWGWGGPIYTYAECLRDAELL